MGTASYLPNWRGSRCTSSAILEQARELQAAMLMLLVHALLPPAATLSLLASIQGLPPVVLWILLWQAIIKLRAQ